MAWGLLSSGAARWSEIEILDPLDIWGQGRAFKLVYGVMVSAEALRSCNISSVTRADRQFTDLEVQNVLEIVTGLYVKIKLSESVIRAQLEALTSIANGYHHADAVKKLQIFESAAHCRTP